MSVTKNSRILVLFDVDGTLTMPRERALPNMSEFLQKLREKVTVGIVGGSDLVKQKEQVSDNVINEFDYSFSENGLVAYKNGELIGKEVIIIYY
jgi:phosphomannomutase